MSSKRPETDRNDVTTANTRVAGDDQDTVSILNQQPLDRDLAGQTLGDYEIHELLGRGGMGVVYRARQVSLDREVALKLLNPGTGGTTQFIDRFRLEARNAARMEHRDIVSVYETGVEGDLAFFSMQYVQGSDLAEHLKESRPDAKFAARLVRTLAEAVEYAHELNVLHLDLKPGNVLIEAQSGRPVIADFGLSRPLDHAVAHAENEVSGTPNYMAPEQVLIRDQRVGRHTDVFALGAILYEMLTGYPPFQAATPELTLQRVVSDQAVDPRLIDKSLPADLSAIALKCLAKDPAERYPSAGDLADDLMRFLDDHPVHARTPGFVDRVLRWLRQAPITTGGLVVATIVLLVPLVLLAFHHFQNERRDLEMRLTKAFLLKLGPRELDLASLQRVLWDFGRSSRAWRPFHHEIRDHEYWIPFEKVGIRYRAGLLTETGRGLAQSDAPIAAILTAHADLFRFIAEGDVWIEALDRQKTAYGYLAAWYLERFASPQPGPVGKFLGSRDNRLRRAMQLAWDEPAALASIANACNFMSFQGSRDGLHPTESTTSPCAGSEASQRLLELEPDNLGNLLAMAQRSSSERDLDGAEQLIRAWQGKEGTYYNDHLVAIGSGVRDALALAAQALEEEHSTAPAMVNIFYPAIWREGLYDDFLFTGCGHRHTAAWCRFFAQEVLAHSTSVAARLAADRIVHQEDSERVIKSRQEWLAWLERYPVPVDSWDVFLDVLLTEGEIAANAIY